MPQISSLGAGSEEGDFGPVVPYLHDPIESDLNNNSYVDEGVPENRWNLQKGFMMHFKPGERRILSVVFTPTEMSPEGVEYSGNVMISIDLGDLGMAEMPDEGEKMTLPWFGRCAYLSKHKNACTVIQKRVRGIAARAKVATPALRCLSTPGPAMINSTQTQFRTTSSADA